MTGRTCARATPPSACRGRLPGARRARAAVGLVLALAFAASPGGDAPAVAAAAGEAGGGSAPVPAIGVEGSKRATRPAPVTGPVRPTLRVAEATPGVGVGLVRGSLAFAGEAVPACTTGDDPAPFREPSQWRSTLLDTRYRVGRRYAPDRLVSTSQAGTNGGHLVRRAVVDDLAAMVRAARRAGVTLRVNDGYRTWAEQRRLYEAFVAELGEERAARRAARPGHSEHHLGTAIDFANTAGAWDWLARRGWRFGFVVSYPRGARDVSCYRFEPWHLRYVGRSRAAAIHESGLVPRAWLWVNVVAPAVPALVERR